MDEANTKNTLAYCKEFFPERVDVRLHHGREYPLPQSIKRGIVFVTARASAPAKISLERFTSALTSVRLDDVEIHFLDADNLDEKFARDYGNCLLVRSGECFWIKDGKIVHADSGYHKEGGELSVSDRIKQFFSG